MRVSRKLERIPPYLFAQIDKKIAAKQAKGVDVISFGVGDPDRPTPEPVVDSLCIASSKPENQRYPSYFGLPEFRRAAALWFERRFGVKLDPDREILPLIGSKEGIAHLSVALLDPGDISLVPEPSYPVYAMGALLAGAEPRFLPLTEEHDFLPDLDAVAAGIDARTKLLWLNYPNNPTGAIAHRAFFEKAVEFAAGHDVVIAHDNAYSEITYDGFVAPSFLEVDGARDVGVEFHSLSKTFNMSGWRIGFACGNAEVIEALGTVKTNIDSGIFNPVQIAGVRALEDEAGTVAGMRELYQERRDTVLDGLEKLGWKVTPPGGSIYIWMRVPEGYDSVSFSMHVLDNAGVFFTPGNSYGPSGEGFVRISLTVPDERIHEAFARLREFF